MTQTTVVSRIYDEFAGPDLDMSRWVHLEYPAAPGGTSWRCAEPTARTEVGNGTLAVHVERFERAHDHVQIMDNPKHLLLSTESFAVPPIGCVSFSIAMAARGINAAPRDYRDGFASMNVLDMASGWVFDLCLTSDTILAIYERLPMPGVERPFTYVVENPLAGVEIAPGRMHRFEVTLDAARGAAEWRVDGQLVYDMRGVEIPDRVNVGMGLITLHPIVGGRSRSVRGQGLSAVFGALSVSGGG